MQRTIKTATIAYHLREVLKPKICSFNAADLSVPEITTRIINTVKNKYEIACSHFKNSRFRMEDSLACFQTYKVCSGIVYDELKVAIADGIGSEADGHIASSISITDLIRQDSSEIGMKSCINDMHNRISWFNAINDVKSGSTIVLASISKGIISLCYLGDSPFYLLDKNGNIKQSIKPHSNEKGHLTRSLGDERKEATESDYMRFEYKPGDYALLSSDGLIFNENFFKSIIKKPLKVITMKLTEYSIKHSTDNISLILIHFQEN